MNRITATLLAAALALPVTAAPAMAQDWREYRHVDRERHGDRVDRFRQWRGDDDDRRDRWGRGDDDDDRRGRWNRDDDDDDDRRGRWGRDDDDDDDDRRSSWRDRDDDDDDD